MRLISSRSAAVGLDVLDAAHRQFFRIDPAFDERTSGAGQAETAEPALGGLSGDDIRDMEPGQRRSRFDGRKRLVDGIVGTNEEIRARRRELVCRREHQLTDAGPVPSIDALHVIGKRVRMHRDLGMGVRAEYPRRLPRRWSDSRAPRPRRSRRRYRCVEASLFRRSPARSNQSSYPAILPRIPCPHFSSTCDHAARMLLKNASATAVAVFTLALAIGATTAIFSVVYGVLLRPLPYPAPDRLMAVWEVNKRGTYSRLADRTSTTSAIATARSARCGGVRGRHHIGRRHGRAGARHRGDRKPRFLQGPGRPALGAGAVSRTRTPGLAPRPWQS